jgi:hypothetical protein
MVEGKDVVVPAKKSCWSYWWTRDVEEEEDRL